MRTATALAKGNKGPAPSIPPSQYLPAGRTILIRL
jgi:hypothetical protein